MTSSGPQKRKGNAANDDPIMWEVDGSGNELGNDPMANSKPKKGRDKSKNLMKSMGGNRSAGSKSRLEAEKDVSANREVLIL
jgi:hypothetical protein